jgi:hypothetical protein
VACSSCVHAVSTEQRDVGGPASDCDAGVHHVFELGSIASVGDGPVVHLTRTKSSDRRPNFTRVTDRFAEKLIR